MSERTQVGAALCGKNSSGTGPTISIIVNTCDRRDSLMTLLYALNRQTFEDFEVVVVVGPTRDDSAEMLGRLFADQVRVVRCGEFNLSTSRNVGLREAAGEIVAFVDDDAVPCPTWLAQLARGYDDPEVSGVGGRTYNVWPEAGELQFLKGIFSVVGEQEDVRTRDLPPAKSAVAPSLWFPRFHGTNMSYRRKVLLDLGGFDERYEYLFDDADIAVRLGRKGHRLLQLEEASVYHVPASGRNRGQKAFDLNWYCWLRSTIYFALKNGLPAAGWVKSLKSAKTTTSMFFSEIADFERRDLMDRDMARSARRQLHRGWIEGLFQGIFLKRKLADQIHSADRTFLPFLREDSAHFPAIPPIGTRSTTEVLPMKSDALRICLLSVAYPPENTHGVARSTHSLALGLVELGHEVHVVTAGDRHRVISREGVFIHEVAGHRSPRYDLYRDQGLPNLASWLNHSHGVLERIRSLIVDHTIEIVDSPLWNLDGLVTAIADCLPVCVRVVTSMKQIATIHGRGSEENRILGDLESEFLDRAAGIISNSKGTVETLKEVYELDLDRMPHFRACYGMVPSSESTVEACRDPGQAPPTVLFVGRLEKRKGILDLFEAIPEVLNRHPETRFAIVGSDNSREDGFWESHRMDYPKFFAKKHSDCVGSVDFHGFVDEDRLQDFYRDCSLFVAPSLYESFGLIFLEAMNCAKPVIGCRSGGPEEIILDGETGLLVDPHDPSGLADAISTMIDQPERRREMGLAGRRRLVDRYSHTAMATDFVAIYRRILAETKE